ncbi:MAG TPA: ABC transporter permease [Actinomycetota bacterium]|nr:ABC transporter permease [Actinomycetota bacterium]
MSDAGLALRQVRYTNKAFWRNPASAFFTFAFPLMFLVIFTALFGNSRLCSLGPGQCPPGEVISTSTFYVAAIAAFSIITATYTNLAISVSFSRDAGVLKRTRGTPLPAWAYMFGRIVHAILVALLLVAIVMAFGTLFYDAEVPTRTLPAFLATIVVGAACFSALGLALTSVIPNADASPAIVNASILPLLFLSGIFIPIQNPDAWYVAVAKIFPVYHFAQAMNGAYFAPSGSGFRGEDLLVLGIWGVAGVVLAVLFFSWEPRR